MDNTDHPISWMRPEVSRSVNLPSLSRETSTATYKDTNVFRNQPTKKPFSIFSKRFQSTCVIADDGTTVYRQSTPCSYDRSYPSFSISSLSNTINMIKQSRPKKPASNSNTDFFSRITPEDREDLINGLVTTEELRIKYASVPETPALEKKSIVHYSHECEEQIDFQFAEEFYTVEPELCVPVLSVEPTITFTQPIISEAPISSCLEVALSSSDKIVQSSVCGVEYEHPEKPAVNTIVAACHSTSGSNAMFACHNQLNDGCNDVPLTNKRKFPCMVAYNYKKRRRRW